MRKKEDGDGGLSRNAGSRGHDPPDPPKSGKSGKDPPRRKARQRAVQESPPLCREAEAIRTWLKQVRFKRAVFGGVNEADVWKKIGELNTLYEEALAAERMRYDALLNAAQPAAQTETGRPEKAGEGSYE